MAIEYVQTESLHIDDAAVVDTAAPAEFEQPHSRGKQLGLHELPIGARARITSVSSLNNELCHKLLSMGMVEGQVISLKGIAPLGDPIQIEAIGYKLSLRKSEAAHIQVRLLPALTGHK